MALSASNPQSKVFDFTKRKRWADLLVTELSGVVMIILSASGNVMFCGEAAKELLHWKEDVSELPFTDLMHPDDGVSFSKQLNACIQDPSELALFIRLKCLAPDASSGSKTQWPLYEVKGHPFFAAPPPSAYGVASSSTARVSTKCNCFFIMARPYPTHGSALLDSFLELKLENERLRQQIMDLRSPKPPPYTLDKADVARGQRVIPDDIDADAAYRPQGIHGLSMPLHSQDSLFPGDPESASRMGRLSMAGPASEDVEDLSTKKKKRKTSTVDHRYVCVTCGRTDSPEWRKGPLGPKTLCNACGLRHSKKTKRKPEDDGKNADGPSRDEDSAGPEEQNDQIIDSPIVDNRAASSLAHQNQSQSQQQQAPPPQRAFYPVAMPMPVSMITGIGPSPSMGDLQPQNLSQQQQQHLQQHHQQHMPQYAQSHQSHRAISGLPPIQTQYSYSMDGRDLSSSSLSAGYLINNLPQHRLSGNMSGAI